MKRIMKRVRLDPSLGSVIDLEAHIEGEEGCAKGLKEARVW